MVMRALFPRNTIDSNPLLNKNKAPLKDESSNNLLDKKYSIEYMASDDENKYGGTKKIEDLTLGAGNGSYNSGVIKMF
jgi:hypothetical protein